MRIIIAILILLIALPVYGEIAQKTYSIKAHDEVSDSAGELVWFSAEGYEPINSLVKITNTDNGRSITARTIKIIEPYYWKGKYMTGYLPRKERALLGQPNPIPVNIEVKIIKRGK